MVSHDVVDRVDRDIDGGHRTILFGQFLDEGILATPDIVVSPERHRAFLRTDAHTKVRVFGAKPMERLDQQRIRLDVDATATAIIKQRRVTDVVRMMGAQIEVARLLDPEPIENVQDDDVFSELRIETATPVL